VGHSEILNNVCKAHVCGEDKKCTFVVPTSLSSSMQVLFCQRTRRNEVMSENTNAHTDTYFTLRAE
jgi:hypothetical protein